jgi:hypothetical protein
MGASISPAIRVKTKRRNIIPEKGVYLQDSWRSERQGEEAVAVVVAVEGEVAGMRKVVR